ncbi:MAG: hypothetical protein ACTSVI_11840 [Promethearchaeota archaeon]
MELTKIPDKKLEYIDHGEYKFVILHEGDLMFLLISKHYLPVLRKKLYNFKETFLLYYGDKIHDWAKDSGKFLPAKSLVSTVFGK